MRLARLRLQSLTVLKPFVKKPLFYCLSWMLIYQLQLWESMLRLNQAAEFGVPDYSSTPSLLRLLRLNAIILLRCCFLKCNSKQNFREKKNITQYISTCFEMNIFSTYWQFSTRIAASIQVVRVLLKHAETHDVVLCYNTDKFTATCAVVQSWITICHFRRTHI